METFYGKSVFGGIAIGKLHVLFDEITHTKRCNVANIDSELIRFRKALNTASAELSVLFEKSVHDIGEANAAIFDIHKMMLEDEDYISSIEKIIRTQSVNAEYAVSLTGDNFSDMFNAMDDVYMKARSADVKDISDRLIQILCFGNSKNDNFNEPVIILADDLSPSRTAQLDKNKVLSFVTVYGSSNSHTAILAKTLGIPSIIGCSVSVDKSYEGKPAIADGYSGRLIIDPDEKTLSEMEARRNDDLKKQKFLMSLKGKPNITLDGRQIRLYANIGNVRDLAAVSLNDAEGIGLFRSEFIYMEQNHFPTEEEQFRIYKQTAEAMEDKTVIIRTLDIGADKKADCFCLEPEENPAMGYRAIRICLSEPEIFKTQLRAIFRAGIYGNLNIMYPMITSLDEIKKIKKIAEQVRQELYSNGIEFAEIPQGIMIETPAAAVISDILAAEVDFFSIGTNDLTQYMLAADRQNEKIEEYYNPHHPAILRTIKTVIDNGHKHGIWVGICGELGSDISLTETLLKMGVDELSVSPSSILPVRKKIRECRISGKNEEK